MPQALVLGGGFAGLESAIFLRKQNIETTLVSDRDYLWLYPVSIWIPTNQIKPEQVKVSLPKLARKHGFSFILDTVTALHTKQQTVELTKQTIPYDYLVLAMGAHKALPIGHEHTLSLCGQPEVSSQIKEQLDTLIKKGSGTIAFGFGGNPKDPSAVRGGPLFELMLNFHHMLSKLKIRNKFKLIFFAPMDKPGKKMGEAALKTLNSMYQRFNIETKIGTKIKEFTPQGVTFIDDSFIESDLTLFIPPGKGHTVIAHSNLPLNEAGFIKIDQQCRVKDHNNIWAIGDIAAIEGPDWRAKQGHVAESMAKIAAKDIALAITTNYQKRADDNYQNHIEILCLMDMGSGGALVKRTNKKASLLFLPLLGHWLKRWWAIYWKWSKMKFIPRLPGM